MTRHYPDLGSASDWLKFASTNQKHKQYPDLGSDTSSVWNFCTRFPDVICGEASGGIAKYRLFSQPMLALQSLYGGKIDLINLNDKLLNLF